MRPSALPPSLVLMAYAESLCRGARVLVLGDARSPLGPELVARGARLAHVCDRDGVRRAEAAARNTERALSFGSLDDGPAALREGFFDLALIENLAEEGDPRKTLESVSRLLAARGAVLAIAPNPERPDPLVALEARRAMDYYALYDAVASPFPHVRMLGQVPFVGYAVVDFAAEGEPSPVLDASLVPGRGEEPDYFVAFGAREPRSLDEYAVIQLPSSLVRGRRAAPVEPLKPSGPSPDKAPNAELERRVQKQEAWIAELEGRAAIADERADAAEAELDELRERLAAREQAGADAQATAVLEHGALRTELEAARQKELELSRRLAELEAGLAAKDALLAANEALLAEKEALLAKKDGELRNAAADPGTTDELARLEAQLQGRSQEIRRLEERLRDAERTGRELVRKLSSEVGARKPTSALSERLAEAEAELVTLRWSLEMVDPRVFARPAR